MGTEYIVSMESLIIYSNIHIIMISYLIVKKFSKLCLSIVQKVCKMGLDPFRLYCSKDRFFRPAMP